MTEPPKLLFDIVEELEVAARSLTTDELVSMILRDGAKEIRRLRTLSVIHDMEIRIERLERILHNAALA